MQLRGDHLLFSPSDLANFVACEHLSQLELAVALGEIIRPSFANAYVDLIARKGVEHERNFLDSLRLAGHVVTEVGLGNEGNFAAAAAAAVEAMHSGAKYIYQAVFYGRRLAWDRRLSRTDRSAVRA